MQIFSFRITKKAINTYFLIPLSYVAVSASVFVFMRTMKQFEIDSSSNFPTVTLNSSDER